MEYRWFCRFESRLIAEVDNATVNRHCCTLLQALSFTNGQHAWRSQPVGSTHSLKRKLSLSRAKGWNCTSFFEWARVREKLNERTWMSNLRLGGQPFKHRPFWIHDSQVCDHYRPETFPTLLNSLTFRFCRLVPQMHHRPEGTHVGAPFRNENDSFLTRSLWQNERHARGDQTRRTKHNAQKISRGKHTKERSD